MPTKYLVISVVLLSAFLGFVFMYLLRKLAYKNDLFDNPEHRKLHKTPIPRLAGLSFFPVLTLVVIYTILVGVPSPSLVSLLALFISLAILFGLGIKEDLHRETPGHKFIFQIAASLVYLAAGIWLDNPDQFFGLHTLGWFGAVATVSIFLHIINAINLIDGIDGLSTELCIFSAAVSGALEFREGNLFFFLLALAVISLLVTFLFFNFQKDEHRKMFMGDTGCWTLGVVCVYLALHAGQNHPLHPDSKYLLVALSPLLVPLMDMARVALFRVTHGISVVRPDNNHIHHILLRAGLSVRQTRLAILGVTIFHTVMNAFLVHWIPTGWLFLGELAVIIAGILWVNAHYARVDNT